MMTPPCLSVHRLSGALGAVVGGVDLSRPDASTIAALRRLLTDHHVVVIPGQQLDEAAFIGLATGLGELAIHPVRSLIGRPQALSIIEDTADRPPAGFPWHTDLSWLDAPPRFGFLQALTIPPHGGDTMWASTVAAHRALSPVMQELCGRLRAVHRIDASFRRSVIDNHGPDVAQALVDAHPPITHPLVRAHPDTGEPALWLSPLYVDRIVDMAPAESALILTYLNRLFDDPGVSIRWRWSEGDVVIWDETCTVHRALTDHFPHHRRMRRCTTTGPAPEPISA